MFWFDCAGEGPGERGRHRRMDPFAFIFGMPGPGGPGHKRRGGRMFEQGDLKYVILRLLEEKPRHGYEIIKELEERSGGTYAPSPGTVYPTLQMLEDLGYARVTPQEAGKKIYEITDEGRAYLAQNKSTVEDIFERMARFGESFFGDAMGAVHGAFKDVARATYSTAPRCASHPETLAKVREILERAAREIDELGRVKPSGG